MLALRWFRLWLARWGDELPPYAAAGLLLPLLLRMVIGKSFDFHSSLYTAEAIALALSAYVATKPKRDAKTQELTPGTPVQWTIHSIPGDENLTFDQHTVVEVGWTHKPLGTGELQVLALSPPVGFAEGLRLLEAGQRWTFGWVVLSDESVCFFESFGVWVGSTITTPPASWERWKVARAAHVTP